MDEKMVDELSIRIILDYMLFLAMRDGIFQLGINLQVPVLLETDGNMIYLNSAAL